MTGFIRTAAVLVLLPASAAAQTPLLEVDKGEDNKLMQVNDDGGFVVRGRVNEGSIPASGPGTRLVWYPRKSAFRAGSVSAGQWDDVNVGVGSVAMGQGTTASRFNSMAMGNSTTASGDNSTAMGNQTTASNNHSTAMGHLTLASGSASTAIGHITRATNTASTAMGDGTLASGVVSTALGRLTTASGITSTAMGNNTEATGEASTAMGSNTKAIGLRSIAMGFRLTAAGNGSIVMGSDAGTLPGGSGSFVYGDASTDVDLVSFTANEFVVRASGGFRLRTSPTLNTGCDLAPGAADWACTSSRLAKEGFEDLDGETVLEKLAGIPIQRWRYRGTEQWHVGPTAEDFYGAFELGQGPTTISTMDADGISLVAVQALEQRTAELRAENAELRARLAEDTAALRTELEELRRLVENGRDDK